MNWFEGIIANIINALANGIGALVHGVTSTANLTNTIMGNIIMSGFFRDPSHPPMWGAGNFSDIMDPKAVQSLKLFSVAFWSIGWTFFTISVYLLASQISGAAESSIQRERLKKGLTSLIVASVLIWQGSHLAVLVTQIFFYLSDYFLTLNPLSKFTSLNTGGNQALLNSTVNLVQAVLSIIVWIVYQFRMVFLYVWMLFFPLAMAFYANDKTRGITKMWWTEWIYQMAIPFGQAVVYGVASAVAAPTSGTAVTAEDVFVALAGTIGLLASATYMRKLVEMVAQGYGASMIGASHGMAWGNMAMMGGAALAGDMMGKASVKAGRQTVGKGMGKAWQKWDNSKFVNKKTRGAIEKNGEVHAGSIQGGASVDDIMMGQKLGSSGDALQSGGVGLEAATGGSENYGGGSGSFGSRGGGSGGGRHPLTPVIRSRTAGEVGGMVNDAKSALRNSNTATWLGTVRKGYQNKGGIMGSLGNKVAKGADTTAQSIVAKTAGGGKLKQRIASAAGGVSNVAQNRLANDTNRQERLNLLRAHMAEVVQNNEHAQRVPGISAQYDSANNTFQGNSSPAEKRYRAASQEFVEALQSSGMSYQAADGVLTQAQQQWTQEKHLPNLGSYTPQAQEAYRKAFTAYQPAKKDNAAKKAVLAGNVAVPQTKDPQKTRVAGSNAFLNDARNAIMYRR